MEKSGLTLVVFPGELSKAANMQSVSTGTASAKVSGSTGHPAGLSNVKGKTKSKIPYTGHAERMALAKMAKDRMLGAYPSEDEGQHADALIVDRRGREKGEKPSYPDFGTAASGSGSQAHDNFGRQTILVKPTDIGSSAPESASKYGGVKKVAKPRS